VIVAKIVETTVRINIAKPRVGIQLQLVVESKRNAPKRPENDGFSAQISPESRSIGRGNTYAKRY